MAPFKMPVINHLLGRHLSVVPFPEGTIAAGCQHVMTPEITARHRGTSYDVMTSL